MMTLADRVFSVTDANGATEYANSPTPPENREAVSLDDCRDMSAYEMEVRDWGVYFGVAYGIARSEDPFESTDQVGERAFAAAEEAWTRGHVPDPVPPIGQPPMRFSQIPTPAS